MYTAFNIPLKGNVPGGINRVPLPENDPVTLLSFTVRVMLPDIARFVLSSVCGCGDVSAAQRLLEQATLLRSVVATMVDVFSVEYKHLQLTSGSVRRDGGVESKMKEQGQHSQVWTREPPQLNAARPQVPTYVDLFEIYVLTKQKSNCGKMRQFLRNCQNQAVFAALFNQVCTLSRT